MSLKLKDIVGNIFYTDEKKKAEEQRKTAELQQKVGNVFGTNEKGYFGLFLCLCGLFCFVLHSNFLHLIFGKYC